MILVVISLNIFDRFYNHSLPLNPYANHDTELALDKDGWMDGWMIICIVIVW